MSNDASPDDQRAQSTHALEMKVERKLQKDTGFNRHQIRSALHGSVTDFVNQVNRANEGHPEKQIDLPEVKHSPPQILPPLPFSVTNKEPKRTDAPNNSEIGTAVTQYVMGANSVNVANPALAREDTWDIVLGPDPSGGGPYDGVLIPGAGVREFADIANQVVVTVAKDMIGGTTDITSVPILIFKRALSYDSVGKIIFVGPEVQFELPATPSNVTFA